MSKPTKRSLQYVGRGPAAMSAEVEQAAPPPGHSASRYDALTVEEILAHLGGLPATDLARLGDHERAHQPTVLAGIDPLLDNEPWPGYDALDECGPACTPPAASGAQRYSPTSGHTRTAPACSWPPSSTPLTVRHKHPRRLPRRGDREKLSSC